MTHNKLYRNFIILQGDEKKHTDSGDKALSGYAKIEARSDKCKISFYAQNLNEEKQYFIVLICYKKEIKQIVDLGSLMISKGGKGDVVKEYYVNNIAGMDFSYDKISGAAVCSYEDGKIDYVMYGFKNGENVKDDWKKCKFIKSKGYDKEVSDYKVKEDKKESYKDKECKDSDKDKHDDHEKYHHDKDDDHEKHHDDHEKYHHDKDDDHEKHHDDDHEKYHHDKDDDHEKCHDDDHEKCHHDKDDDHEKHHDDDHEKHHDDDKECHHGKDDDHEKCHDDDHEKHHKDDDHEKCHDEDHDHKKHDDDKECDKDKKYKKEYKENKYSKHCEKNDDHDCKDCCDRSDDKFTADFDEYESKIEEEKEIDPYDFELRGGMGDYFKNIVNGFDEIKNKFKDIRYCKWYNVKIKSIDDMCNTSDYNRYTVIFNPMLNYYPYIKKYGHFLIGYKCDKKGNMRYIVYGIPGRKDRDEQPYVGKTGFVTWMSNKESDIGYWLMFYDYKKSMIVVPMK